jgi:hypothetical protein
MLAAQPGQVTADGQMQRLQQYEQFQQPVQPGYDQEPGFPPTEQPDQQPDIQQAQVPEQADYEQTEKTQEQILTDHQVEQPLEQSEQLQEAETEQSAGFAQCPFCGGQVQFYAPVCGSCNNALQW